MLKCPKCKKSIRQKYAAWTHKEPSVTRRVYECPECKMKYVETVAVGSCQVVRVESQNINPVRECLDAWF